MEYIQTIITRWLQDYGFDIIDSNKFTTKYFNSKQNIIIELTLSKFMEVIIDDIGNNGSVTLTAKNSYDFPEVLTFLEDLFNAVLDTM